LSDVLQAEAGGTVSSSEDVAEVERYIAASLQGFELIKTLPITQRLILQLHATLLRGVRGEEKQPEEIRRSPVWVGSPTDSPDNALFVPPLPGDLPALLTDWERFVNPPAQMPTLIRCALMHYQFETIHPFLDGKRPNRSIARQLAAHAGRPAHEPTAVPFGVPRGAPCAVLGALASST
jgi:Fic family protein